MTLHESKACVKLFLQLSSFMVNTIDKLSLCAPIRYTNLTYDGKPIFAHKTSSFDKALLDLRT